MKELAIVQIKSQIEVKNERQLKLSTFQIPQIKLAVIGLVSITQNINENKQLHKLYLQQEKQNNCKISIVLLQIFYLQFLVSNNCQAMMPNFNSCSKKYPKLNWEADKNKDEDELFERVLNYCTEHLMLSSTIFTGEREFFKEYVCEMNLSGGREWHNPTYSLALSLLHNLQPEQLQEHIILYHGVKCNAYYKQIFKSKLRPGPGQAYQGQRGKNPKLIVPNGIYGSQFLNITMGYSDHNFPIIIQFAAKNYVQSQNKTYFVVQQAIPLKLVFPFEHLSRGKQCNQ